MKKIAAFIVQFRIGIMVAVTVLTVAFAYQIPSLKINSDFVKSLPDDDPIAMQYKQIGKKYKGTDIGMIVLETENIYTAELIKNVQRVTDSLKLMPEIATVTSLTNIINIKSDSAGIEIGSLIDEYALPQTDAELADLKLKIDQNSMYKGSIVSEDGTATMIMFTMQSGVNNEEVMKNVKTTVNAMNLPERINYGGMPMMLLEISDLIIKDIVWLVPIISVVLIVILFLSFHSLLGTVLPLLAVAIAGIWTFGIMALLNYDVTMVGGVIPVVLFAVGSAYAIHVVNHIKEITSADFKKSVIESIAYLFLPVFLSSLTTVFGFLSFIFGSYLGMIQDFGLFAAVGTFFSFVLAMTLLPAIQSYFPNKATSIQKTENQSSVISTFILKPLNTLLFKHPKYIFAIWISILVFGLASSTLLVRNTNVSGYFKEDNAARISENILQTKFGGSSPVYVVFEGDMQSPEVLSQMRAMEVFLKQNPYISSTNSIAGLIEELNDAMGEGKKIPDDRAKIEQLWFLLDGQDALQQLVADDLQEGVIQARFASVKSRDTDKLIADVSNYIAEHQTDACKMSLNGMPSIYSQMDKSLLNSQISSIALAILLVFLLIGFSIKSFKLGFFGIIPILATIVLLFGFMGITGIPLDIATVLVASVAIGIGIDYSIHIISSYNHYLKEGNSVEEAIQKTILLSGKAIVINVLSVAAGFLVLVFSQIVPMQFFGLLVAISMLHKTRKTVIETIPQPKTAEPLEV